MSRYKKLKPQVELRATGRILIRDNRKTHYKFTNPRLESTTQRFHLRGKSSKYIINTVIPYYRIKIHNEQKQVKMYKEKLVRLQGQCNKIIRTIRSEERKSLRALIRKNNSEFQKRLTNEAIKIANKKVNTAKISASIAMQGALAYPVLLEYAHRNKIAPKQLGMLMILHIHDMLGATDFIKFGYTCFADLSIMLKALEEKGFAERFEKKNDRGNRSMFLYSASVKGHKAIAGFTRFYNKYVKSTIESDEYKEKALRWRDM